MSKKKSHKGKNKKELKPGDIAADSTGKENKQADTEVPAVQMTAETQHLTEHKTGRQKSKPAAGMAASPSEDRQNTAQADPDQDRFVVLKEKTGADIEKADDEADQKRTVIRKKVYERELKKMQLELVKLQEWVRFKGLKVVVVFEGRDAAGKGGVIKRITEALNPRICRVEALPVPTEKEKTQWYFQRYVSRLPAAGEIVLFDRSWYNRAGVERVMGFCTEAELREFLRSCPEFERMLIRSGIILLKYWFSVSDEEQEKRFQDRLNDPTKRWKLSKIDLESRSRWIDYSRAKDEMFAYTDTRQSPWFVVNADVKRHARLNCISHVLGMIPYEDLTPPPIKLPPRQDDTGYVRPPIGEQTFVPERFDAHSR